jgi:serine/threonine protein kinase
MKKYNLINYINSGRYSKVYKYSEKKTGNFKAMKKYNKKIKQEEVVHEKHILDLLDIPNEIFKYRGKHILVMPFYGQVDMFEFLRNINNLTTLSYKRKVEIVHEAVKCIEHIQRYNIVHGDIKLENLIVEYAFPLKLKLVDFGMAEVIENGHIIIPIRGTLEYISPEILEHKQYKNSDMYAIGVIIKGLWTNDFFYKDVPIVRNRKDCLCSMKHIVPDDVYSVLKRCLTTHDKRLCAKDLLDFDMFK